MMLFSCLCRSGKNRCSGAWHAFSGGNYCVFRCLLCMAPMLENGNGKILLSFVTKDLLLRTLRFARTY